MSAPQTPENVAADDENPRFDYWRLAVWIAVGALIAAALVSVVWVLIGNQYGIVGRAFLTILLLAGFAGAALLDANLADRRPQWYVLLSMVAWVVILLAGAVKIWSPQRDSDDYGGLRVLQFLLIVLIVRLAVLHVWLYVRAHLRHVTAFNQVVVIVTVALIGVLTVMLVVPLTFPPIEADLYWRLVVSVAILAAVGTALVPLVRALTAPPRSRRASAPPAAWPTFADGRTPLPVLPGGQPDLQAYYTGHPTAPTTPPRAPAGEGYRDFPPPAPPEPARAVEYAPAPPVSARRAAAVPPTVPPRPADPSPAGEPEGSRS